MNKKKIKTLISLFINFLNKFYIFKKFFSIVLYSRNSDYKIVVDKNFKMKFYTPNELCAFRVKTFYSKEPETIDWINSFKENKIFWDIGANIGLYSCYAALKKKYK